MTLKKQLNEAIKALKAEMKMKKMEEAVRHAEEKERISREYAEQLEALINCVTEAEETERISNEYADNLESLINIVETVKPIEETEEIKEIITDECFEEVVTESKEIASINEPETVIEKKEEIINVRKEIVKFLIMNFVKTETNINMTIPEFHDAFMNYSNVKIGKNTFTKELKDLGIWHYKSNGTIKYAYDWKDIYRGISKYWIDEPEPEAEEPKEPEEPEPKEPEEPDFIIQEDEDDNAEESDETNLYLFIQNHAEVVEKKSSNKAKIDKMTKIK